MRPLWNSGARPARQAGDNAGVQFYFDFISPFGYFASLRIDALAAKYGREVEWRSMLIGVTVLKVMGMKPLLETPLKGDYIRREFARYQRRHGLALKRQPDDPMMDPRSCGRAFHWTLAHHPQLAKPLARALFHRYWVEAQDLSSPESVVAAGLPAGLAADELLAAIQAEESGKLLRAAVEQSMQLGVFGSPTVAVDGELFWGVESFPTLEDWLAKGGW
jgi:2-hydroxychromene-2-carboxylate isomerase